MYPFFGYRVTRFPGCVYCLVTRHPGYLETSSWYKNPREVLNDFRQPRFYKNPKFESRNPKLDQIISYFEPKVHKLLFVISSWFTVWVRRISRTTSHYERRTNNYELIYIFTSTSTPAGKSRWAKESNVLSVGSIISITRLWMRIS